MEYLEEYFEEYSSASRSVKRRGVGYLDDFPASEVCNSEKEEEREE